MTGKQVLKHLILIALLARALVPAGWMPVANAVITICSVEGKKVLHPDAPAKGMPFKDCAYGAVQHVAFIPEAPVLTAPAVHVRQVQTDRIYAAAIVARFSPGSPRAPPLNA